jgi:hypothetical protein
MIKLSLGFFLFGIAALAFLPLETGRLALFGCLALAILTFLIALIRRPPLLEA